MGKDKRDEADPEPRKEYDFGGGVRGKYARRCAEASNIVVLDPDVARALPDSASVNRALRSLVDHVRDRPSDRDDE